MAYPRIMANDCELEKMAEPGTVVMVSLPALIKSASTWSGLGYGPFERDEEEEALANQHQLALMAWRGERESKHWHTMPSNPFSLCSSI